MDTIAHRFGRAVIIRDDFYVVNPRGLRVVVSLWRPSASESKYRVTGSYGAAFDDALVGLVGPQSHFLAGIPTVLSGVVCW